MLSRCYQDVIKMLSRCHQDVIKMQTAEDRYTNKQTAEDRYTAQDNVTNSGRPLETKRFCNTHWRETFSLKKKMLNKRRVPEQTSRPVDTPPV